jgi:hypothetical protein
MIPSRPETGDLTRQLNHTCQHGSALWWSVTDIVQCSDHAEHQMMHLHSSFHSIPVSPSLSVGGKNCKSSFSIKYYNPSCYIPKLRFPAKPEWQNVMHAMHCHTVCPMCFFYMRCYCWTNSAMATYSSSQCFTIQFFTDCRTVNGNLLRRNYF